MKEYQKLITKVYDRLDKKTEQDFFANNSEFERLEEHNLWTYWQGKGVRHPKIMVVGQDWGSLEQSNKYFEYIKNNPDAEVVSYVQVKETNPKMKKSEFTTDKELERFLGEYLNYPDVCCKAYDDLYFTNLKFMNLTALFYATGNPQNISLLSGTYLFECWGAQGGAGRKQGQIETTGGKGAYASVYLCQHNKSKKLYAMKIIDKFFLSQHNKTNDVLIEKAMLSSINHSNIIKLIQTFQSKSKLFFILELATNSTLDVLIEKYPFVLSHKCIKTFCFQIAKALKYLHVNKLIVHRDIKPENICLDENYNVKLIDFASGTEIGKVFNAKNKCFEKEKEDVTYIKEPIGSYEYVSPEMLNCVCVNQSCNDIWSFGCLVYQLYHKGKTPFKSYCQYDTLKNIKENKQIEFDVNIPLDAKDLIMKCLQFDYKIRINNCQI